MFSFFFRVRALVGHSYLQDATGAGLSALVDLAVAQGAVGTVLSTDADDGAVFGFVTALPLRYLAKENPCAQVCFILFYPYDSVDDDACSTLGMRLHFF